MSANALEDNEEIKLLYTSSGPNDNKNLEYYVHLIVVSQKTGDTVNVLTTLDNGFAIEDKDKVFLYLSKDNPATKIIQTDITQVKDADEINRLQLKDIKKVLRDPKFDYIANNNFPTVIGAIGFRNSDDIPK